MSNESDPSQVMPRMSEWDPGEGEGREQLASTCGDAHGSWRSLQVGHLAAAAAHLRCCSQTKGPHTVYECMHPT